MVKPQEQTVVFVATKHHVEYLKEVSTPRMLLVNYGGGINPVDGISMLLQGAIAHFWMSSRCI